MADIIERYVLHMYKYAPTVKSTLEEFLVSRDGDGGTQSDARINARERKGENRCLSYWAFIWAILQCMPSLPVSIQEAGTYRVLNTLDPVIASVLILRAKLGNWTEMRTRQDIETWWRREETGLTIGNAMMLGGQGLSPNPYGSPSTANARSCSCEMRVSGMERQTAP
ncbi:hypothetical protein K504DRAFT_498048 [Pleomassaria siparia CBS 279.74]|uniref:Uncharacterized protein n=1 Tax=Pleomassaria siparia CBS 279.74 TaxID=1314801 RepID=A0A6G1KK74_9PLEO|nr:hypothetical protein K504DRAFT_498048 [Pleomassaria siparia CBS 279.74]